MLSDTSGPECSGQEWGTQRPWEPRGCICPRLVLAEPGKTAETETDPSPALPLTRPSHLLF